MNRRFKITCAHCSQVVIKTNQTETCSMACRGKLRVTRIKSSAETGKCPACGIDALLYVRAHGAMTCSKQCAATMFARHKQNPQKDFGAKDPAKACDGCGNPFPQKKTNERFCCEKCSDAWNYLHKKKSIKTESRKYRDQMIGSCSLCGVSHEQVKTPRDLGSNLHPQTFCNDHILPKSKGGADAPSNRRWLCWFCNTARRDISQVHDGAIAAAGKAFWSRILPTDKLALIA